MFENDPATNLSDMHVIGSGFYQRSRIGLPNFSSLSMCILEVCLISTYVHPKLMHFNKLFCSALTSNSPWLSNALHLTIIYCLISISIKLVAWGTEASSFQTSQRSTRHYLHLNWKYFKFSQRNSIFGNWWWNICPPFGLGSSHNLIYRIRGR